MKAEQLTRALYDYCLISARIEGVPLGYRVPTWEQLAANPVDDDAHRWRAAVRAFLDGIGATEEWGEEIVFSAMMSKPIGPPRQTQADDGEAHQITPDGG